MLVPIFDLDGTGRFGRALFAGAFGGPKRLEPVLDALQLEPGEVVFVGDTDHDRRCAAAAD